MDIVYYVRPGEKNEELRYSLRSLVNLPHERVWVIGHTPRWVTGVESIPGNRGPGGPQHVAIGNLGLACEHVEADSFVVFNDDFYVMEPIEAVPSWHRGPLREWRRSGAYGLADREAYRRLTAAGIPEPLDWTLHIPLVVERDRLADVLRAMDGRIPPEWRTMYGNLSGVTGATPSRRGPSCRARTTRSAGSGRCCTAASLHRRPTRRRDEPRSGHLRLPRRQPVRR
jgi:hypothetical protein